MPSNHQYVLIRSALVEGSTYNVTICIFSQLCSAFELKKIEIETEVEERKSSRGESSCTLYTSVNREEMELPNATLPLPFSGMEKQNCGAFSKRFEN